VRWRHHERQRMRAIRPTYGMARFNQSAR
jgi:hypothetical protein